MGFVKKTVIPAVQANKIIRPIIDGLHIREVEKGVRYCMSSMAGRISGKPKLHIQLRMEGDKPGVLEVLIRATGELVGAFAEWRDLEAIYGPVVSHVATPIKRRK